MSASRQLVITLALVTVVAVVAVVANLALLRSTQDSSDPVGRLSPRAVFSSPTEPSSDSGTGTTHSSGDDHHDGAEPDD